MLGHALPYNPKKFLLNARIREGCTFLTQTKMTIAQIANAVGFEDEYYFSRRFRLQMGIPPSDYRKRHCPPIPAQDKGIVRDYSEYARMDQR